MDSEFVGRFMLICSTHFSGQGNTLILHEGYFSIWGSCVSWGRATAEGSRGYFCGLWGTQVKTTKSRVGWSVRSWDFSRCDLLPPTPCWFRPVDYEKRKFYTSSRDSSLLGHLLADCVVWRQVFLELLCEHRSPVMQGFHMNWGSRDYMDWIWEDSPGPSSL